MVIDTAGLRRIGGAMGSNPAGIFQDERGRRFYVKTLESPLYARNEILAAMLYRLAGAPTLTYVATIRPDEVATELVALAKNRVAQLSPGERRQAQSWFGVHAWTANWDVAGLHGDNQGVVDGMVLTLDLGGALDYRAMGDPKGRAFGSDVGELDRLRQDADNPAAMALFGAMTEADIQAAIRVVTRIPDDDIRRVVGTHGGSDALAAKMIARKADMARRLAS